MDKHTQLIRLLQAQPQVLGAGSIWKCSQMANWHQRQDKRPQRLGSQADSPASEFRHVNTFSQRSGFVCLPSENTCAPNVCV